jgi:hypothetical protein
MPRQLYINNHLFIPFGQPKWKIEEIKVKAVSPNGTYFESDIPFAYINKNDNSPLQIADFWEIVPEEEYKTKFTSFTSIYDEYDGDLRTDFLREFETRHTFIFDFLIGKCQLDSVYEKKFLEIYLNHWWDWAVAGGDGPRVSYALDCLKPLLPLPQAHLYLEDKDGLEAKMYRVDYAFWTGKKLIVVEIDSPTKSLASVISRDRRYQELEVEVIHILNHEIDCSPQKIIGYLPMELRSESFVKDLPKRQLFIRGIDKL